MTSNRHAGYRAIGEYYESLIRTGKLASGTMLPTEPELSKKHKVTRTTIRRAFDVLAKKGLINRYQGRGTFVAKAADVESRTRARVVVAMPRTLIGSEAPGGLEIYHEGMYQFLEAFTAALAAYGRPVRVFYYGTMEHDIDHLCASVREEGDLGIIIYDVAEAQEVDQLLASEIPTVFVDCATHGRPADIVKADNTGGAFRATQHLLETTAGALAYLGGLTSHDEGSPHKERLDGFRQAHAKRGREVREDFIRLMRIDWKNSRACIREMLALKVPPAGYVCSDDELACGVLDELRAHNVPVPAQISVVGFGDTLHARLVTPALSTLAMDPRTMGLKAVELLHERIRRPESPPKVVSVPVRVVLRQTTVVASPAKAMT